MQLAKVIEGQSGAQLNCTNIDRQCLLAFVVSLLIFQSTFAALRKTRRFLHSHYVKLVNLPPETKNVVMLSSSSCPTDFYGSEILPLSLLRERMLQNAEDFLRLISHYILDCFIPRPKWAMGILRGVFKCASIS